MDVVAFLKPHNRAYYVVYNENHSRRVNGGDAFSIFWEEFTMLEWLKEFWATDGEYMLRILLAAVMGGIIGTERSRRQKEAGIRTHVIVAVGSALIMVVSKYGFFDLLTQYGIQADPSRLASNIVTGVSFLGAGVIFVKNVSIRGLTTAAGIWATAGVGTALGAGLYAVGIFTGLLIIVLQFLLHNHLNRLEGTAVNQLEMRVKYTPGVVEKLKAQLAEHHMSIEYFRIKKSNDDILTCSLALRMPREMTYEELLFLVDENEEIIELDM